MKKKKETSLLSLILVVILINIILLVIILPKVNIESFSFEKQKIILGESVDYNQASVGEEIGGIFSVIYSSSSSSSGTSSSSSSSSSSSTTSSSSSSASLSSMASLNSSSNSGSLANPSDLCQYASSATASSENSLGNLAVYATGSPDASKSGICSEWSGYSYSWSPLNWNVKASLTLKYDKPVLASNLTVFGDYDMCLSNIWIENSLTGDKELVFSGFENNCIIKKDLSGFYADTVILETCGWAWSSTDAVQLCGNTEVEIPEPVCGNNLLETGEECDDSNLVNGDGCDSSCKIEIPVIVCGNSILEAGETCDDGNLINGDGCSSECKIEIIREHIYVVPYVGDISGDVDKDWLYFYGHILNFYDYNHIPGTFSFYPRDIIDDDSFTNPFKKMYQSTNIELLQKGSYGYGSGGLYNLSFEEQKNIIKSDREFYINKMKTILGTDNIKIPTAYNHLNAEVDTNTQKALKELGFFSYFDVYLQGGFEPLTNTEDFDVVEYGVSFTKNGEVGKDTVFYSKEELIKQIKEFDLNDSRIIYINNSPVIPLWTHHMDFEDKLINNKLDIEKWNIYTDTILTLNQDKDITLLTPEQVYSLRHEGIIITECGNYIIEDSEECDDGNLINGDGCSSLCKIETVANKLICQYASSATASSENSLGNLAVYATGSPNAPKVGTCTSWSGYGYTWSPLNWNVKASLTLKYDKPVLASNLTVFGDYDMCIDKIWLKNSLTGEEKLVFTGPDSTCVLKKDLDGFYADSVVLETCGWAWSSTDAVQLCGKSQETNNPICGNNILDTGEECDDGNVVNGDGCSNKCKIETDININICKWKNCEKGAVSVSVDDYFTSCKDELDKNNYKGTYFLTETNTYNNSQWNEFNAMFNNGHELGTHTQSHICSEVSDEEYIKDLEKNIVDIVSNTDAQREEIISHCYPCGFTTDSITSVIENNWNFLSARGYNFNEFEKLTPEDFYELKSFNSIGYPGEDLEPPDYYNTVDLAEEREEWANLVFHNWCDDDGVIDYLPEKNLWVDTIGNVVKYIKLRDSSYIYNLIKTDNEISFRIKSDLTSNVYNQDLTLEFYSLTIPSEVLVDNNKVDFRFTNQGKILFDIKFPIDKQVKIIF
ncbi:MAG: DUF4215 domain-containing protein [archaeon]